LTTELVREASRDGRRIALLRVFDSDGASVVEAEVLPQGAAETVSRGPYRFKSATEAFRFLQEAVLALEYLGCQVD
jgi:hypothetical protein